MRSKTGNTITRLSFLDHNAAMFFYYYTKKKPEPEHRTPNLWCLFHIKMTSEMFPRSVPCYKTNKFSDPQLLAYLKENID